MIDFRFRLLEREDLIALSQGEAMPMLSPTAATVNRFLIKPIAFTLVQQAANEIARERNCVVCRGKTRLRWVAGESAGGSRPRWRFRRAAFARIHLPKS